MDGDRRTFLQRAMVGLSALGIFSLHPRFASAATRLLILPAELPQGARASATLEALPGKKALIKQSYRPPNYETPRAYFKDIFTPNDVFFVRYHLAAIPKIDVHQWRLRVGGDAATQPLELSLDDLQRDFAQVELAAMCLCSGNRRGLFQPHVPGVQWGYGAMGNALWKGIRLRDVLDKAGIGKNAVEVTLDGADTGALANTPDFIKSLPMAKAMDENTLIAFEMNGKPLPQWNGFPARLVVPGWTGTYWVKHLTTVNIVSSHFDGFWMKTAYRIPKDRFPLVDRFISQESEANTPITESVVNSLITDPEDGQTVRVARLLPIGGIAWDGGHGITQVEVSLDRGRSWREAQLGKDYGRYSWRRWRFEVRPSRRGELHVLVRAINRLGMTQPLEVISNPAGYHHNAVQTLQLKVT